MIPYTITPRGVSFIIEGRPRNILNSHPMFDKIIEAIHSYDINLLKELCDLGKFVAKISHGAVQINDDEVRYNGMKVNQYLAERIIEHWKKDFPIEPLCNFTERLMQNPTFDVREDLFRWLENGNMPVCSNGNFIAYKFVRSNFTPIHNGPYGQDQSVGQTVEMPREACDSNRNSTCSTGLHFCSFEYLPSFGYDRSGNVVIILEIDPADVVAIPTDYNLSKGRTCKFKVIGTVHHEDAKEIMGSNIYDYDYNDEDFDDYNDEVDEEEDYNDHIMYFYHKATNQTFSSDDLMLMKDELGTYAAMSRQTRVPADTISGWYSKIVKAGLC
jgi:hypothetical protein